MVHVTQYNLRKILIVLTITLYGFSLNYANCRIFHGFVLSANRIWGQKTPVIRYYCKSRLNEGLSLSMLPFETDVALGEITKNYHRVMPKVVPDQRSKFENDELFRKLTREGEIKYTGFKDRPLEERQLRFQTECREGHADLAFVATGINLQLQFSPNAWSENPDDRIPTQEFVNFDREPGKVHLKSQFILNGVCVVWKGWLDLNQLDGIGSLEYDVERAMIEDNLLRQQIDQYNRQLRDFEDRQRHYREEQERRAETEAEEYHRFIRSRVELFEKSHPIFLLGLDQGKRRLSTYESSPALEGTEMKKTKKSASSVQVPVPVKPIVASSSLHTLGSSLTVATGSGLQVPRLHLSTHTATSAILGPRLHVYDNPLGPSPSAPVAIRNSLIPSCPVKLYPWKPNMYLV